MVLPTARAAPWPQGLAPPACPHLLLRVSPGVQKQPLLPGQGAQRLLVAPGVLPSLGGLLLALHLALWLWLSSRSFHHSLAPGPSLPGAPPSQAAGTGEPGYLL